jgi:hypothetical protein
MMLSRRLRDVRYGLGGFKYQTNIRYLLPQATIVNGYKHFVDVYCDGAFQLQRLRNFFALVRGKNFVPLPGKGYGRLRLFLRLLSRNPLAFSQLIRRLFLFSVNPRRVYYAFAGAILAARNWSIKGWFGYYQFWLFAWSNAVLKYMNLSDRDFDIESVNAEFNIEDILPDAYVKTAAEPIPGNKIAAQLRATATQLEDLVRTRRKSA